MTPLGADLLLGRVRTLPPLPQAVHDLREALRADNAPTERIVRSVGSDQALTMTALKLANSSFYGVGRRVVTLRDAVQILGLSTLSAAVMTAAVMSRFDPKACAGFDFDGCWRHAMATGLCAQMLAPTRDVDADSAYTAGLLHDVGRLALATHFPLEFAATMAYATAHDVPPEEAETRLLGMDHAQVGAMVAEHWRLAPAIVDAIRMHHAVPAGDGRNLLDILHLADNIVHALDLANEPNDMVPQMSLEAWDRIGPSNTELQRLFERIEDRMRDLSFA